VYPAVRLSVLPRAVLLDTGGISLGLPLSIPVVVPEDRQPNQEQKMTVHELIEELEKLPRDLKVLAFGPQWSGSYAARPVISVVKMEQHTLARGKEEPIVFIQTSIFDR
jgi:hypothetical protein